MFRGYPYLHVYVILSLQEELQTMMEKEVRISELETQLQGKAEAEKHLEQQKAVRLGGLEGNPA